MAVVRGTADGDVLAGTDEEDLIHGEGGDDTIAGLDGNDRVFAGDGNDLVEGNDGDDLIIGGAGNDEIFGGLGADRIDGGDGDDSIVVNRNRGDQFGPTGDPLDYVFGGAGNDSIATHGTSAEEFPLPIIADGGIGDDSLRGGWGTDTLLGGDGNDTLLGFVGDDFLDGGAGNDDLTWGNVSFGGIGEAQLLGGAGNDVLRGGLLMGSMDGGEGDDRIVLGAASGGDLPLILEGGVGFDTLDVGRFPTFASGELDLTSSDLPTIRGFEAVDLLQATSGAATLVVDQAAVLALSDETDRLLVEGGAEDRVVALGDWTATGTESIAGQDYARFELGGATLLVNTQTGTLPGEARLIAGTADDDTLFGTPRDDVVLGNAGSDTLFGADGDDVLHGGNEGDFLAGDGGDVLSGNAGNDLLNGGFGPDTFVFAPGDDQDNIFWLEDGTDTIDLRGFAFGGLDELQDSATITEGTFESGAPFVTLDFGEGDVLTAAGLTVAAMDSGDFLF